MKGSHVCAKRHKSNDAVTRVEIGRKKKASKQELCSKTCKKEKRNRGDSYASFVTQPKLQEKRKKQKWQRTKRAMCNGPCETIV